MLPMQRIFSRFSSITSKCAGSPWTFLSAVMLIAGWLVTGPLFNFSDTWQLFINTFTTIITFLMVFLIQNTQNRDTKALHLKLDELIKSVKGARLSLLESEDLSDIELDELREEYKNLRDRYYKKLDAKE